MGKSATALGIAVVFLVLALVLYLIAISPGSGQPPEDTAKKDLAGTQTPEDPTTPFTPEPEVPDPGEDNFPPIPSDDLPGPPGPAEPPAPRDVDELLREQDDGLAGSMPPEDRGGEDPDPGSAVADGGTTPSDPPFDTVPGTAREEDTAIQYATYTTEEGESLWMISVQELHDGKRWREILALNPDLPEDGEGLAAGLTIRLPAAETSPAAPEPAPAETWPYDIQEGDTLAGVAKRFYGDGTLPTWKEILAVNPGLDPDKLQVGQTVKLPVINGKKPEGLPGGDTAANTGG
jgi:nucleoid-associated protein YgaU